MGAVMSPQDRAASSPSPSPCTPCPRCCEPGKTHKQVSHTVKHKIYKHAFTLSKRIIVWPHLQSCEGWGWASRRAACRRSWWIAPGAHFRALRWWCKMFLSDLPCISSKGCEESTFVAWTSWSQCRSLMALFWSSPTARRLEIPFIASSSSSSSSSSLSSS